MRLITRTTKLLWHRLPRIALYTVAFYALFWVGQQTYYRFAPAEQFIRFYKVQVQNAREGQDIPFQVCRTKDANYQISGYRTFYKLTETDEDSGQRYAQSRLEGALENDECANLFIRVEKVPHTPGSYYFVTELEFSVNGYTKHLRYKSNVYSIVEQPLETPEQIQDRIDDLQRQIDELKASLARRSVPADSTATGGSPEGPKVSAGNSPATPTDPQPSRPGPVPETPSPSRPSLVEQITRPVFDLLDGLL